MCFLMPESAGQNRPMHLQSGRWGECNMCSNWIFCWHWTPESVHPIAGLSPEAGKDRKPIWPSGSYSLGLLEMSPPDSTLGEQSWVFWKSVGGAGHRPLCPPASSRTFLECVGAGSWPSEPIQALLLCEFGQASLPPSALVFTICK